MTAAEQWDFVGIDDYLKAELVSEEKHEFVDGIVHSMAGARAVHTKVAMNAAGTLFADLLDKPCRPYGSDMLIRIQQVTSTRFYYPDLSVFCSDLANDDQFSDSPTLVLEVLSPSTRRIDLTEKKEAYLTLSSLNVYLIVDPDKPYVIVYRRGSAGFEKEIVTDSNATIQLPEIEATLPMMELYRDVDFE